MDDLPAELWHEIINYVPYREYARLVRVNRRWFLSLSPRLWKYAHGYHLSRVATHRRPIYTPLIEQLTLSIRDPEDYDNLGELDFTQLKTLIFDDSNDFSFSTSCLMQYLAPSLTSVHLDHIADPVLLSFLASNCRRLRHVELDLDAPRLTNDAESVMDFLQLCPSLVHITLYARSIPSQVLRMLASKRNLKQLDINSGLGLGTVDAADLASIPRSSALPSLERLELGASVLGCAIPPFLPFLHGLRDLCIRFSYRITAIPMPVPDRIIGTPFAFHLLPSHLPNLRILDIKFYARTRIRRAEFISLGSLTELRELHLATMLPGFRIPRLNDDHFRSVVSRLTNLRELSLFCTRENLTTASLITLGESCPFLRVCTMPHLRIGLLTFETCQKRPLLPELTDLVVDSLTPESESEFRPQPNPAVEDPERISNSTEDQVKGDHETSKDSLTSAATAQASLFLAHFPEATHFDFWRYRGEDMGPGVWEFCHAVRRAWRKQRREQGKGVRSYRRRKMEYETPRASWVVDDDDDDDDDDG
ncbi:uncharacterized protein BJX67DRAFT_322714 [Aspergillus lucknowensis]|uniref:F-box domain-containing protein n=1 Tax=Aspergillus lucknowensis TaxID=176173 RepID=A0ABR4LZ64_9EURO